MAKTLRDSGKEYVSLSKSKKVIAAKKWAPLVISNAALNVQKKLLLSREQTFLRLIGV